MSAFKRDYEMEAVFPTLARLGDAIDLLDKHSEADIQMPRNWKPFDEHDSRDQASLVSELCKRDMGWFYESISERGNPAAFLAALQSEDDVELGRLIRRATYDYCRKEIDKRLEDGRMRS